MLRSEWMIALVGVAMTAGCASAPPTFPVCTAANSPNSICGLMNPEDLDFLPGREWIVVSQMAHLPGEDESGAPPARGGNLLAIRLADLERQTIFPASAGWALETSAHVRPTDGWGDPTCAGAPSEDHFQPHGIAVGQHGSGVPLLAVVNHGGREAVELFEIEPGDQPGLGWRGCVPMPEGIMGNDLALFADGGFVVTKFMAPVESIGPGAVWSGVKLMAGWDTGGVYRWTPGGELVLVAGSEGSAPNGIALSADETEIFVAQWGESNVYRVSLDEGGREREEAQLEHRPDNLTWTEDGKLLVAGQAGSIATILSCGEIEKGSCALDYGVYSIDPVSLEVVPLFTGVGAASVALEVGDEIFVGAFSGDQIERVARPR
jgi:SMP-30/Gluconolactonase/LRE-like region